MQYLKNYNKQDFKTFDGFSVFRNFVFHPLNFLVTNFSPKIMGIKLFFISLNLKNNTINIYMDIQQNVENQNCFHFTVPDLSTNHDYMPKSEMFYFSFLGIFHSNINHIGP